MPFSFTFTDMRQWITLFFLIVCGFVFSQNGIEVFARGSYLHRIIEHDGKLYIATDGKGLIIYDELTGSYEIKDVSNTPMVSNMIYDVQVINSDTLLVQSSWYAWLVTNGFWREAHSNVRGAVCIANDGTLFESGQDGNGSFRKNVNGNWVNVTDSFTAGLRFGPTYHSNNNELYFLVSTSDTVPLSRMIKYSNGVWSIVPDIHDGVINGSAGNLVFDKNDNVYCAAIDTLYHKRVYELNGNSWSFVGSPDNTQLSLAGVIIDSTGKKQFYISDVKEYMLDTVSAGFEITCSIWTPQDSSFIRLDTALVPNGFDNVTAGSNGQVYFHNTFNGLYHGTPQTGFSKIDYANLCVEDRFIDNIIVSRDSFYSVINYGFRQFDSSLNGCRMVDTVLWKSSMCRHRMTKDVHGDVWMYKNESPFMRNIQTGDSIDVSALGNVSEAKIIVADSLLWICNGYSFVSLVKNNTVQYSATASNSIIYSALDRYGNLWVDARDPQNNSASIYRFDTHGAHLVKQWYCYYYDAYYGKYLSIDETGLAWLHINDTLFAYNYDTLVSKMLAPHTPNSPLETVNIGFQVFDSLEIVMVAYDGIKYFRNGTWSYYDTKFAPTYLPGIYSYHDGRLLFFTQMDGIIRYNLGGDFYHNGNHISGIVYRDANNNGQKDSLETGIVHQTVTVNNDIYSTNSIGKYQADMLNGTCTVKLNPPPYYSCSPDSYSVVFSDTFFHVIDTFHFACRAAAPVNDLELYITPGPFPLGYMGTMYATVKNTGTVNANATVTLKYDSTLALSFSNSPITQQSAGSVTLQFNNIYPQEEVNTYLQFQIGTSNTDSVIHFVAAVNPIADDTTPENNVDSIDVRIVSSFDPNDKMVQPEGLGINHTLETNQNLTYTIRFQNTGSYAAMNIVLLDTLSDKLDVSTFKMISSSHPCNFKISNHVLKVYFNNIRLPYEDESETGSHGYFKFFINPETAVQYGDNISNTAHIYFDFNEPINTNTTKVVFGEVIYDTRSHPINLANPINVIPQPFGNQLKFYLGASVVLPVNVSLTDITGHLVLTEIVESSSATLPTGLLASGIYILNIQDSENKYYRTKCVKLK